MLLALRARVEPDGLVVTGGHSILAVAAEVHRVDSGRVVLEDRAHCHPLERIVGELRHPRPAAVGVAAAAAAAPSTRAD